MPWGVHHFDVQVANLQSIPVGEQQVERPAADKGFGWEAIEAGKMSLHLGDLGSDADRCACAFADQVGCTQMVSVHMGFQHMANGQPLRCREGQQALDAVGVHPGCSGFVVEHWINDGGLTGDRVRQHIGVGRGVGVKEGGDLGSHGRDPWVGGRFCCGQSNKYIRHV